MGTPLLMSLPPPAFPPCEPRRCLLFPRKAAHREAGEEVRKSWPRNHGDCVSNYASAWTENSCEKAPIPRSLLRNEVGPISGRWRENLDHRTVKNLEQKDKPCGTVRLS